MSLAYTYLATNGVAAQLLPPTTETASANGTGVSTAGWKSDAVALVNTGAFGGTNPTLSVKLQSSNDGGTTWTDIPGTTVTPTGAGVAMIPFQPQGYGPMVRAALTLGGSSPSIPIAIDLLGWNK